MKKSCVPFFLALAVLASACGSARATLFFADGFDYPNGELTTHDDGSGPGANVSGGLWTSHSGAGFPTSIEVVNGKAILKEGNPASEDANRDSGSTIGLGETWYYGALITVNDERADPSTTPLLNEYVMHFKDSGNNFRGRTYVGDPSTGTGGAGFRLGLSTSSGGQQATTGDLSFGTQYKIIVSYTLSSVGPTPEAPGGTSKLWVDPTDESSASIMDLNVGAGLTAITSLGMRQAFNSGLSANYEVVVNAVALGTTFDEVCAAIAVPEPSSMALVLLGVMGLTFGSRRKIA